MMYSHIQGYMATRDCSVASKYSNYTTNLESHQMKSKQFQMTIKWKMNILPPSRPNLDINKKLFSMICILSHHLRAVRKYFSVQWKIIFCARIQLFGGQMRSDWSKMSLKYIQWNIKWLNKLIYGIKKLPNNI